MTRRAQGLAGAIVVATAVGGVAVLSAAAWTALSYPRKPHRPGDKNAVSVVVSKGMTPATIARALVDKDLLDHPHWFRIYATERGDSGKIRAGRYTFNAGMSPAQLMDALVAGAPEEEVAVTVPEGKNLLEVAALLHEAGVCNQGEFVRLANDEQLLRALGVPGASVEGYLFPDRYLFRPGTAPTKVIARLVKHAKEVLAEEIEGHKAGLAALHKTYGFDQHQILIMASLVEKETARVEERPRIAGVFLNRLHLASFRPHLLQTDPTIVYGCTVPPDRSSACEKWDGRIHRIHLDDRENPYNTYTHEGLPPGPICNPGRAALEAVLKPDATPFLYFVSKNDGSHYFSKTRAEHEAAVDKYQRHGGT
jgi:UPF0755 protein